MTEHDQTRLKLLRTLGPQELSPADLQFIWERMDVRHTITVRKKTSDYEEAMGQEYYVAILDGNETNTCSGMEATEALGHLVDAFPDALGIEIKTEEDA